MSFVGIASCFKVRGEKKQTEAVKFEYKDLTVQGNVGLGIMNPSAKLHICETTGECMSVSEQHGGRVNFSQGEEGGFFVDNNPDVQTCVETYRKAVNKPNAFSSFHFKGRALDHLIITCPPTATPEILRQLDGNKNPDKLNLFISSVQK